jgi:hypothetical protein
MLASVSYSQTSESSRITDSERAELITRCEAITAEAKVGRILIKEYEKTLAAKESALDEAVKFGRISDEQIDLMKAETAKLREALAAERKALEFKELEAAELRKALVKAVKRKNFFKSIAKISTAVAVVAVGVLVLKQ